MSSNSTTSLEQPRRVFLGTASIDANKIGDVFIEKHFTGQWRVVECKDSTNTHAAKMTLFLSDQRSECIAFIVIVNEILSAKNDSVAFAATKKMEAFMQVHLEAVKAQEKKSNKRSHDDTENVVTTIADGGEPTSKKQTTSERQEQSDLVKDTQLRIDDAKEKVAAFSKILQDKLNEANRISRQPVNSDIQREERRLEMIKLRAETAEFMMSTYRSWVFEKKGLRLNVGLSDQTVKQIVKRFTELYMTHQLSFDCGVFTRPLNQFYPVS